MQTTTPYKVRPECQQAGVLDMAVCQRCGHVFRTQFVPGDQTIAVGAPGIGQPAAAFRVALAASMWRLTGAAMAFGTVVGNLAVVLDLLGPSLQSRWRNQPTNSSHPLLSWSFGRSDRVDFVTAGVRAQRTAGMASTLPTVAAPACNEWNSAWRWPRRANLAVGNRAPTAE
jgi:hypothetical protein